MGDMSAVIVPKSDQINADDLLGRTVTITVTKVTIRGGQEQPISIHFAESDKVFRPCKSMCRVMAQAWGLDSAKYVGRAMTLYCDPSVKFGPLAVGGIRISHMSHIDGPLVMALTATKGVKKSYKVMPLEVAKPATGARQSPADWLGAYIAQIDAAETPEEILAIQTDTKNVAALAKLAKAYPDLHGRAVQAGSARMEALQPNDGRLSADNPSAGEGRDDPNMGDEFVGADDPFDVGGE